MTAIPLVLNEKVLVLNRLYAAIRVISARRAFIMLCKQAAEVIAVEDGQYVNYDFESWTEIAELQREFEPDAHAWVRTPRIHIAVPKIIRLFGYDRLPRQEVKLNRRNLYARDGSRCQYCGGQFPTRELTIDHVTPRVLGGQHSWTNLVCACVTCNAKKGGRTPKLAGLKLIRNPVRPNRNPVITLRLGDAKYHSWKAFLNDAYWTVELRD
ncbi:MAG: HNH endonuclease [Phycisphaerales bacterium]|nr:HNH endonuclease [Planctomycetota bacterium]MCZ6612115.1 HNH endonuclease [Planctomycetota bacterium]MCZ6811602.1 HNH endonuclease [Planctomycetota bacterium]MCZ6850512.1 HNH endonuclease [Planctomycetota bacterium]